MLLGNCISNCESIYKMDKELISWWKTNFGKSEIQKIKEVMASGHITQGAMTEELEKRLARLLDVPYAVLTTNGSTALLMALIVCGVNPKDEIIIPNFTFVATAQAPLLLGARIKLVDSNCRGPLVDVDKIEKAITPRTKIIIPVHLNGRAVDIRYINKLAAKYNIKVIEDAAQALCSRNNRSFLGTQSYVGIFSLAVTKLITTAQGGLLVTRNKKVFEKLKKIRNYGMPNYTSFSGHNVLGFNFKFNDILAAVGLSQIEKIKEKVKYHKDIYNLYKFGLKDLNHIKMINVNIEKGELPLWVEVTCSERERVIDLLKEKNIEAKPFDSSLCDLFYPNNKKIFKHSRFYTNNGFILPSGSGQSKKNIRQVIKTLRNIDANIEDRFGCNR